MPEPRLQRVTSRVNCPHCHRTVEWSKTPEQAAEDARITLAAVAGLLPTKHLHPIGGED